MKKTRSIPFLAMALCAALSLTGCEKEPETPGEHLDKMIDDAGDALEDAGDAAEDAADDASDALKDDR